MTVYFSKSLYHIENQILNKYVIGRSGARRQSVREWKRLVLLLMTVFFHFYIPNSDY